ncbi:MAG: sel1 repeat family protein [Alphaproteobacteria bacterium]|nr:sel1 repeat family protein [Alphaproteobacteria bacterium]
MRRAAAALLAAFLTLAAASARADEAGDVAEPLRPGVSAYRAGDLATAEQALRPLASAGDADAQAWLGAVQLDRGATREALALLQRASDGDSAEGHHRLALVFADGTGVPRNEERAAELFRRAAEAGHRRAQLNLATLHWRGRGVARDPVEARAWFEKAAADGDPHAQYLLGRTFDDTAQPGADLMRAIDLFRRAAERGHPLAALRLGLALSDPITPRRDVAQAQRWLTHAWESGVPEAALALGDLAARMPAQRDKARNEELLANALGWYRLAADAGVPSAQFKLANAFFAGAGVARDAQQAQTWYERAARQGLPEAQHTLGIWLISGLGGRQDMAEGYQWLLLAERAEQPDSRAIREKLAQGLSDADRRQGERQAAAFKPQRERPPEASPPRLRPPAK